MSQSELRTHVQNIAETLAALEDLGTEFGDTVNDNPMVASKVDNVFKIGISSGEFYATVDFEDAVAAAVEAFLNY